MGLSHGGLSLQYNSIDGLGISLNNPSLTIWTPGIAGELVYS